MERVTRKNRGVAVSAPSLWRLPRTASCVELVSLVALIAVIIEAELRNRVSSLGDLRRVRR